MALLDHVRRRLLKTLRGTLQVTKLRILLHLHTRRTSIDTPGDMFRSAGVYYAGSLGRIKVSVPVF